MNWLDVVIIITWAFGFFIGWRMGLFGAMFTAGGLIFGVFLAARFSDNVSELLTDSVSSDTMATVVAYGIILFIVFVVAQVVRFIVKGILKLVFLGWVDSLGGIALGLVAGVVLSGGLITMLARYSTDLPEGLLGDIPAGGDIIVRAGVQGKLNTALVESALVPVFLDIRDAIPGQALGFVPDDFNVALDLLEAKIEAKEGE